MSTGRYGGQDETSIVGDMKSQVVSRVGAFGTSSARNDTQKMSSSVNTPGPGNYAEGLVNHVLLEPKKQSSYMFTSKSTRFPDPKGPTALDYSDVEDPEDKPKGDPALLGPGAYYVQSKWNNTTMPPAYAAMSTGFSSSSDRFKHSDLGKNLPGPGDYDSFAMSSKPIARPPCGFVAKEARFISTLAPVPGPGHYHPEHVGSMLNHSFNVTVDGHLIT